MANLEQTQSVLDRIPAARPVSRDSADPWRTVLRVAWLAIGLGLALEILLLVLAAFTDTAGAPVGCALVLYASGAMAKLRVTVLS